MLGVRGDSSRFSLQVSISGFGFIVLFVQDIDGLTFSPTGIFCDLAPVKKESKMIMLLFDLIAHKTSQKPEDYFPQSKLSLLLESTLGGNFATHFVLTAKQQLTSSFVCSFRDIFFAFFSHFICGNSKTVSQFSSLNDRDTWVNLCLVVGFVE